jgi:hypothetical protein
LTAEERAELEGLAGGRRTVRSLAQRARIVLAAADENMVNKRWSFAERRLAGLYDEPRPGTPRRIGDDEIAETIRLTLETTPPDATHWNLRAMARAVGYASSRIHRLWKAFGLRSHRAETRKLSIAKTSEPGH